MDHTWRCLSLSILHYSFEKADHCFHLTQFQVITCSLVCLLNVSRGPSGTGQGHILEAFHQNKYADCLLCVWGKAKNAIILLFLHFISSLSLRLYINQLLSSGCLYKRVRGEQWKVHFITRSSETYEKWKAVWQLRPTALSLYVLAWCGCGNWSEPLSMFCG